MAALFLPPHRRSIVREVETGREAVYRTVDDLLAYGAPAHPRGQTTVELEAYRLVIHAPWDTLPTGIGREKLNPAIGALEAIQNLAGRSYLPMFKRMVPSSAKWDDDVPTYGERLRDQMPVVERALRADPWTRQAVATVWRHDEISDGSPPNICATHLQFTIRRGALDMHVSMRSNDAWWGLSYDLFQFAQVQCTLANILGRPVGIYVHDAWSMHLYERHLGAAGRLVRPSPGERQFLLGIGHSELTWADVQLRARFLAAGAEPTNATGTERWFAQALRPYQVDEAGS